MPTAIVTGSGGLIGSESVRRFIEAGWDVVGIENDMRARFFGEEASTAHVTEGLREGYPEFRSLDLDIRDAEGVSRAFADLGGKLDAVIHTAAQPSHDWAAREPQTDFGVNALGTLNLLEAAREHAPDVPFIFCSTNKVYGDTPNHLPLEELEKRARTARVPSLPQGHRHLDVDRPLAPTRSSASPRRPPTCSCRSTAATSTCRPSASAAVA